MPFRWSFIMADGKTLCDKYKENAKVFEEARKLDEWYYGKTSLTKNHIKLFADILKRKNQKYLYKVSLVNQIGFKDVNNKVKRLKDYEGKWVHIDIWATWCKTCKIEYSFLKKLEEHFTAKQEVQIIFISTDRKFDHCKNHLLENKLEGVQLYSGENSEFVKFFVKFYDIGALVRFIMLDKEGKIMSPDEIRPSNPELLPKLVSIVSSKKSNIVSKVKIGY